MNTEKSTEKYYKEIHSLGRYSTLLAILLMFCVPLGTMLIFKVKLNWKLVFSAALQLCIVFIPTQLTEVLSFSPLLGSGGTYLSFITGNVINMKLPAATSGQRLLGVEAGSDESEVVSVLAIGMSSITTTLIITLGVFVLAPFVGVLSNPVLKPAFDNIMPALLGAMIMPYLLKNTKLTIVPIVFALVAGTIIPTTKYGVYQGYLLPVCMIISVLINVYFEKRNQKQATI